MCVYVCHLPACVCMYLNLYVHVCVIYISMHIRRFYNDFTSQDQTVHVGVVVGWWEGSEVWEEGYHS